MQTVRALRRQRSRRGTHSSHAHPRFKADAPTVANPEELEVFRLQQEKVGAARPAAVFGLEQCLQECKQRMHQLLRASRRWTRHCVCPSQRDSTKRQAAKFYDKAQDGRGWEAMGGRGAATSPQRRRQRHDSPDAVAPTALWRRSWRWRRWRRRRQRRWRVPAAAAAARQLRRFASRRALAAAGGRTCLGIPRASPPQRRQRHDSPDTSLPQHGGGRGDASPPQRRQQHDSPGASPPRRGGAAAATAAAGGCARVQHGSPDASPPRLPRAGSREAPPPPGPAAGGGPRYGRAAGGRLGAHAGRRRRGAVSWGAVLRSFV